jgi:hypothetical protein
LTTGGTPGVTGVTGVPTPGPLTFPALPPPLPRPPTRPATRIPRTRAAARPAPTMRPPAGPPQNLDAEGNAVVVVAASVGLLRVLTSAAAELAPRDAARSGRAGAELVQPAAWMESDATNRSAVKRLMVRAPCWDPAMRECPSQGSTSSATAVVSVTRTGVATPTQPTIGSASHQAETFFEAVGYVIPFSVFQVAAVPPEREGQAQYHIRGGDPLSMSAWCAKTRSPAPAFPSRGGNEPSAIIPIKAPDGT